MTSVTYILGASGTGKSTRALAKANDHNGRIQCVSTDVIRAQLRAVLPQQSHPELWAESFNVPMLDGDEDSARNGVNIAGFLRQSAPILRAIEAAVEYCVVEDWDCIVEGVHLVPGEFALPQLSSVEVTAELCVVEDQDAHRAMFVARERDSSGGRSAAHYHANLERIGIVQAFIQERWDGWNALSDSEKRVHAG